MAIPSFSTYADASSRVCTGSHTSCFDCRDYACGCQHEVDCDCDHTEVEPDESVEEACRGCGTSLNNVTDGLCDGCAEPDVPACRTCAKPFTPDCGCCSACNHSDQ